MTIESLEQFRRAHRRPLGRLYARIRDRRWKPSESDFVTAVYRSTTSRFRSPLRAGRGEVERYLGSLHVEDLALACACETGSQAAWLHFVASHRPALNDAILDLTGDPSRAREIGDLLDADLHGVQPDGNPRPSLLQHFQGRSSLVTWLLAVVARAHFDQRWRTETSSAPCDVSESADPEHIRLERLLGESLGRDLLKLSPQDRLRLALYHSEKLSLPQIARLLRETPPQVLHRLRDTHRELRKGLKGEILRSCT